MPSRVLPLDPNAFDPETTKAMGQAMDLAMEDILASADPLAQSELAAKRVIELAQCGERDPRKLCAYALAQPQPNSAA